MAKLPEINTMMIADFDRSTVALFCYTSCV